MATVDAASSSVWLELLDTTFSYGWIQAGGIRTRVLQAGPEDAPAIVLLHGTQGSLETFCRNVGPLSTDHRVVAFDLVGSGFSAKPDYDYDMRTYAGHVGAVMDALKVKSASLVGVSLGAGVAARFLVDSPERVDGAVLISPVGLSFDQAMVARVSSQRTAAVDDPTRERVSTVIRNLLFDDDSLMPDIVAVRQRSYQLPEARAAVRHAMDGLQDPARRSHNVVMAEEWAATEVPVLLVLAVDSPDGFLDTARRLAQIVPNATTIEMKGVSHWPHFEDPPTFNGSVTDFLGKR